MSRGAACVCGDRSGSISVSAQWCLVEPASVLAVCDAILAVAVATFGAWSVAQFFSMPRAAWPSGEPARGDLAKSAVER